MTVCIPFHQGDAIATQRLVDWIHELGGCSAHDCRLIADAGVHYESVRKIRDSAARSFREVVVHTNQQPVSGWIEGSNSLFMTACYLCQGQPFLWLEPDAVPLKPRWLDAIQTEYVACKKPFLGPIIHHQQPGWPNPYMEGVAVYPSGAFNLLQPSHNPAVSWTNTTAPISVPRCHPTKLIQHVWGERNNPPVFEDAAKPGTNIFGPENISPEAVIFHRAKDADLIKLLKRKAGIDTPTRSNADTVFGHGGDAGDLIYGLCAVKAFGGGRFAITRHAVREAFTPEKASLMLPLLAQQPYLFDVGFEEGEMTHIGDGKKLPVVDVDLNKFRELQFSRRHHGHWETITATHLRLLGLPVHLGNSLKWIHVNAPNPIPGKPVVINRTERYQNHQFPWKKIMGFYRNKCVFIGTPKEHNQFQRQFGPITRFECGDYLAMAEVIAGSKLFIGNQSCAYAMAEGLKVNAILECSPDVPDCVFQRDGLIVGRDGNFKFPQVD